MGRRTPPNGPDTAVSQKDARAARLKTALKANMQRRKTQARARTAPERGPDDGTGAATPPKTAPEADKNEQA